MYMKMIRFIMMMQCSLICHVNLVWPNCFIRRNELYSFSFFDITMIVWETTVLSPKLSILLAKPKPNLERIRDSEVMMVLLRSACLIVWHSSTFNIFVWFKLTVVVTMTFVCGFTVVSSMMQAELLLTIFIYFWFDSA